MKKTVFLFLIAIVFHGCEKPEPITKLHVVVKNNTTTSEICIIEKYNVNQRYSCYEENKNFDFYFREEKLFYRDNDVLNTLTIRFLGDVDLCYIFNDGDYLVFKDMRLLSSYTYNEQYDVYEYTITEEIKKAALPCTESFPSEDK